MHENAKRELAAKIGQLSAQIRLVLTDVIERGTEFDVVDPIHGFDPYNRLYVSGAVCRFIADTSFASVGMSVDLAFLHLTPKG